MGLLDCVEAIADPRKAQGVRHPVSSILKAVILGLLAGYTKVEQIAYYIKTVWEQVAEPLGFTRWYAPDPATYRRILSEIPAKRLSQAFENWIAELLEGQTIDVSIDGKACRGFQQGEDPRDVFMMLNVFAHDIQLTLTQIRIPEKAGEPTVLSEHLETLVKKYPGIRLLTGDAYFSGRDLCRAITELDRHYLVRIKANQEEIQEALETWFNSVIEKKQPPTVTARTEKRGA